MYFSLKMFSGKWERNIRTLIKCSIFWFYLKCPSSFWLSYSSSEYFRANKLSSNEDRTRFTLFHKPQDRDNLPLSLPSLKIKNYEINFPQLHFLEF